MKNNSNKLHKILVLLNQVRALNVHGRIVVNTDGNTINISK